jgi:chromate transporter
MTLGGKEEASAGRVREPTGSISLVRLLLAFLKIGSIGFGGGMAVIALMQQEFVRKRRLIPLDEFVHGVGMGQVLGAFAVNVAIFIGYRLFGVAGALLSAGAFLAPSITLVIIFSDLYFRYHAVPALQGAVAGLAPVVIALILDAGWSIGRKVLRSWPAMLIATGALAAGVAQWNAVWVLVAAGAAGFLLPARLTAPRQPRQPGKASGSGAVNLTPFAFFAAGPVSNLFATFFKIGLVFFGGGFVLVPVLHNRLVTQLGWLKPQEFLDGVAISNLTPGPIAVLATFAGFHLAGVTGALAATVALFAPGMMLMLAISHQHARFRDDRRAQRFLARGTGSLFSRCRSLCLPGCDGIRRPFWQSVRRRGISGCSHDLYTEENHDVKILTNTFSNLVAATGTSGDCGTAAGEGRPLGTCGFGALLLYRIRRDPSERNRGQDATGNRQVGGGRKVRSGNPGYLRRLVWQQSAGGSPDGAAGMDAVFSVACLDPGSVPGGLVAETLARGTQDRGRVIRYRSRESAGLRRRVTTSTRRLVQRLTRFNKNRSFCHVYLICASV